MLITLGIPFSLFYLLGEDIGSSKLRYLVFTPFLEVLPCTLPLNSSSVCYSIMVFILLHNYTSFNVFNLAFIAFELHAV